MFSSRKKTDDKQKEIVDEIYSQVRKELGQLTYPQQLAEYYRVLKDNKFTISSEEFGLISALPNLNYKFNVPKKDDNESYTKTIIKFYSDTVDKLSIEISDLELEKEKFGGVFFIKGDELTSKKIARAYFGYHLYKLNKLTNKSIESKDDFEGQIKTKKGLINYLASFKNHRQAGLLAKSFAIKDLQARDFLQNLAIYPNRNLLRSDIQSGQRSVFGKWDTATVTGMLTHGNLIRLVEKVAKAEVDVPFERMDVNVAMFNLTDDDISIKDKARAVKTLLLGEVQELKAADVNFKLGISDAEKAENLQTHVKEKIKRLHRLKSHVLLFKPREDGNEAYEAILDEIKIDSRAAKAIDKKFIPGRSR